MRLEQGVTQKELAEELGVNPMILYMWEYGKKRNIDEVSRKIIINRFGREALDEDPNAEE